MRRAIFAFLAMAVIGSSTGCCCLDRLFCWGCNGCGGYGHAGPYDGCGGCGGGCGGGCSSGGCGGGCSDCGYAGNTVNGGGGGGYVQNGGPGGPQGPSPRMMAKQRSGYGHPMVRQRRDSGDEYEFAAGPPTGATTYPYYTNRGPRDFLARNPRDIGP
jgi:hypothetical protein